jgi:hypothetical protein
MAFARPALAALLALGPAAAAAQQAPIPTIATSQPTDDDGRPLAPRRVEIGASTGMTIAFPDFGVIGSVPLDKGAAIEVVVARMSEYWDEPAHLLAQVQFRLAFRPHLRSRKSLLLGVTRISALESDEGFLGTESSTFVRPHAGVSLQWPVASTLDFRFDAQGILVFAEELPIIPRGMATLVWHPRAGR